MSYRTGNMPDILEKMSTFLQKAQSVVPNLIVDRFVRAVTWSEITNNFKDCITARLDLDLEDLRTWSIKYYPDYRERFGTLGHKKLIEFYTSYSILKPEKEHVFMDAAGGANGYLYKLNCKRKILHDIRIADSIKAIPGVECIESGAKTIPLPDNSVDRISCHHSFEHFQQAGDTEFIKEVQRILKVDGKCCVVPLFVAKQYAEITDTLSLKYKFDKKSLRIVDPTAALPGRAFSGNYARVYSVLSLRERIVQNIDMTRFKVTIYELCLKGNLIPDMSLKCHKNITGINFPYRVLVVHRFSK